MKKLLVDEPQVAVDMRAALEARIVGQRPAITEVIRQYVLFAAGLTEPDTPAGSMLMAGPTGVGKTELAYATAEFLCDRPKALLKIDCGEYQYGHEIAKLVGSPPGYLGHNETMPLLTNETLTQYMTQRRVGVALFDEIEKGHSSLRNLLLGVLDKASLRTGTNTPVDFSRTFIFFTTNCGFKDQARRTSGFLSDRETFRRFKSSEIMGAVRREFAPEFLNRVRGKIVFDYIDELQAHDIAIMQLEQLRATVFEKHKTMLSWDAELPITLVREGFDQQYGARNVRSLIYERVVPSVAAAVLSGKHDRLHVGKDYSLKG